MVLLWWLTFITLIITEIVCDRWDYVSSENGPDAWPRHFAKCNLTNQSPININTAQAQNADDYEPMLFVDYDNAPDSWILTNNGHTLRLDGNFAKWTPQIQGGGLPAKYYLAQVHFHWGEDDFRGSEHHLDGRQYPLEMHLVHVRRPLSDYLRNRKDSRPVESSLAVVAVFFQISNEENVDIKMIIDRLTNVRQANTKSNFSSPDFTLSRLLPDNKDFYRYNGSLTTPACDEAVVWSVIPQPKPISSAQLAQFRTMLTHDNQNLTWNYRPVQKLYNRNVFLYSRQAWLNRMGKGTNQLLSVSSAPGLFISKTSFMLVIVLGLIFFHSS